MSPQALSRLCMAAEQAVEVSAGDVADPRGRATDGRKSLTQDLT